MLTGTGEVFDSEIPVTADIDLSNNNWPVREVPNRFQVFKANKLVKQPNPMQKAKKKTRKKAKKKKAKKKTAKKKTRRKAKRKK